MKKVISLIMSICMVVGMLPFTAYAANSTPEVSLDEFSERLQELQAEYDNDNMFSEITIENGKELCHIDGEEYPVSNDLETTASVCENDLSVSQSAVEQFCDLPETAFYSERDTSLDKQDLEDLGFEVDIKNDKAVLTQPYQTERLIVKSKYDINPLDSVAIVEGYDDLHIVQFDNRESAKQAEEYYNNQKLIEYAEPDLVMSTADYEFSIEQSDITSSNISFGEHLSWGSDTIGVDDYVDYLGNIDELPDITVAIIDTGVDLDHEFLNNRIIETGINYSSTGMNNSEDDDEGHGTHVAGIIADNTTDNVKLKAYKALNNDGSGALSDVVLAIYQAIEDGAKVINMSLSAKGSVDSMTQAIQNAVSHNITVCVAAGNSGKDASKYTPASVSECITVAAIDAYDSKPYWSNWGDMVDIVAPGVSIYSTYNDGGYTEMSGTSMACPFVAAASALMLSKDITLTPEKICSSFEDNGRKWTESTTNGLNGKLALYIGTITDFNNERTSLPVFSIKGGRYSDKISLELNCDDKDAKIYYTTDGSRASEFNGTLYTEPIIIDKVTRVQAVAYSSNRLKSLQAFENYYITSTDPIENFVIDSDGTIIEYNGNNGYLTIPDKINGITVTGLGDSLFKLKSFLVMVKIPDSVKYIGNDCFRTCRNLKSVEFNNVESIGNNAFRTDYALVDINLKNVSQIGDYAFYYCKSLLDFVNDKIEVINKLAFYQCNSMLYIDLPNVKEICQSGFDCCVSVESINIPNVEILGISALSNLRSISELNLPNLRTLKTDNQGKSSAFAFCTRLEVISLQSFDNEIPKSCFENCNILKNIYIPNTISICDEALYIYENSLTIFAPKLKTLGKIIDATVNHKNVNVFLFIEKDFNSNTSFSNNFTIHIIAPSGSYAEQYAKGNGYKFIPSDCRAVADDNKDVAEGINTRAKGKSICTSVAGLRFGFDWTAIPEIENLATDIEYGFVYSQKGIEDLSVDKVDNKNIRLAEAKNRVTNGGITSFNLVISNIPKSYYDRMITARAYVCIDGMYFYSNVQTGSFSEVAKLILADNNIDQNTKNKVQNLLKEA